MLVQRDWLALDVMWESWLNARSHRDLAAILDDGQKMIYENTTCSRGGAPQTPPFLCGFLGHHCDPRILPSPPLAFWLVTGGWDWCSCRRKRGMVDSKANELHSYDESPNEWLQLLNEEPSWHHHHSQLMTVNDWNYISWDKPSSLGPLLIYLSTKGPPLFCWVVHPFCLSSIQTMGSCGPPRISKTGK